MNLDMFSMDMFFTLQQQVQGNNPLAQNRMQLAREKTNLSSRENETLQQMPELLEIINRKPNFRFSDLEQKELERLAEDADGFVGNISRNILTTLGYKFTPEYELPEEVYKTINTTRLNSENVLSKITVYPNPADDYITFKWNEKGEVIREGVIRIINTEGLLIKEFSVLQGEENKLKTVDLQSGLYFYQLLSDYQKVEQGKFLIN